MYKTMNKAMERPTTYAFIDSQNLNLGVCSQGWQLDFEKFYICLKDKFRIKKANVDVELTIDVIKESSLYDNMILISGDSDFAHLIEVLQKEGKKVIVFSARGHVSKELIKLSDYYVNFEKLKNEIAI